MLLFVRCFCLYISSILESILLSSNTFSRRLAYLQHNGCKHSILFVFRFLPYGNRDFYRHDSVFVSAFQPRFPFRNSGAVLTPHRLIIKFPLKQELSTHNTIDLFCMCCHTTLFQSNAFNSTSILSSLFVVDATTHSLAPHLTAYRHS